MVETIPRLAAMATMTQRYWLERAVLDGTVRHAVSVTVDGGRFTEVVADADPARATRLAGLTVPGFANGHSHAFHRALRGRVQVGPGTFWTWRRQMYDLADRLTPDSYYRLARATFAEMVAAGFTAVGEFHYLHHDRRGRPYADANAMGRAVIAAAREVGIRITVLDACYLAAGIDPSGDPVTVEGAQQRFSDGDAEAWARRVTDLAADLGPDDGVRVGAAIHSVRAVPAAQLPVVARWASARDAPLHVHLSEQVAENQQSLAAYGATPTGVLDRTGVLGPRTCVVHATHLSDDDLHRLGGHDCFACLCPTTEQDLGDGIGPGIALRGAGVRITIGTDSQAVIDPFVELRHVEMSERLARHGRGYWRPAALLAAGTAVGQASLGFADAGRIAVGARADLVTLDHRSVRTAGTGAGVETVTFAAGAPDVRQVVIDGRMVYAREDSSGVGADLHRAIACAWEESSP